MRSTDGGFDDAAEIHDHHAVADVAHDREVVADEEQGEREVAAQLHEEVEDLGLDRDVECRDALVADQEVGLDGERAGDADALALTAGELVREAVGHAGLEAHGLEQTLATRAAAPHGPAPEAVRAGGLADDVAHALARVERGHRVLEDDLGAQAQRAGFAGARVAG